MVTSIEDSRRGSDVPRTFLEMFQRGGEQLRFGRWVWVGEGEEVVRSVGGVKGMDVNEQMALFEWRESTVKTEW